MKRSRTFALILATLSGLTEGYITHNSVLPEIKQVAWLKKLTVDICESPAGQLSDGAIREVSLVMKGWASLRDVNAENAVAVEWLIKRLVDESMAGNTKAKPTTAEYNVMLEGWEKSGEGTFAAERCEQILLQMQEQFEAGEESVQPDLASFKTAMNAWKESGEPYGAYRAQRILDWMIDLHTTNGNAKALPDAECFDIVLQSWGKCELKDAPRRAEKLLGRMEKFYQQTGLGSVRPNTVSFNSVLAAWGKCQKDDSWRRMYDVLRFMEKLHSVEGNEMVEPDLITYNIVLGALARTSDANNAAFVASAILRSVEKKHKAGLLSWKPDAFLFNSAMGCWAHSDYQAAYRKARSILDRQMHLYSNGCEESRPDVFGFTSVISSCASEPGNRHQRAKAFNVALSTFHQLVKRADEFGSPNHVTYGTMLKACRRLLPVGSSERRKWTRQLFEECKEKGLVGNMVLCRFREAASPSDYRELMEGYTKQTLPKSWKCNVHERNQYRNKMLGKRCKYVR